MKGAVEEGEGFDSAGGGEVAVDLVAVFAEVHGFGLVGGTEFGADSGGGLGSVEVCGFEGGGGEKGELGFLEGGGADVVTVMEGDAESRGDVEPVF